MRQPQANLWKNEKEGSAGDETQKEREDTCIDQADRKKDNPLLSGWQTAGQNPEYLIGGSDF